MTKKVIDKKGHLKALCANVHVRNDYALRYAALGGCSETVKFLVSKGADINGNCPDCDWNALDGDNRFMNKYRHSNISINNSKIPEIFKIGNFYLW